MTKSTHDGYPTKEPTFDTPEQRLEWLLAEYPNLTVVRERVGPIIVASELPTGDKVRSSFIYLSKRSDETDPSVNISVRLLPKNRDSDTDEEPYTYISLSAISDDELAVKMACPHPAIDAREVVIEAKNGVDIFSALLDIPSTDRSPYNPRAYDWMHPLGTTHDMKESGLGGLVAALATEDDVYDSPLNYLYIKQLLDKNIASVDIVPSEQF